MEFSGRRKSILGFPQCCACHPWRGAYNSDRPQSCHPWQAVLPATGHSPVALGPRAKPRFANACPRPSKSGAFRLLRRPGNLHSGKVCLPSMARRFWLRLAPVSTSCRAVRPSKSDAFRLLRRPGNLHSGILCMPSLAQRFWLRLAPVSTSCRAVRPSKSVAFRLLRRPGLTLPRTPGALRATQRRLT